MLSLQQTNFVNIISAF